MRQSWVTLEPNMHFRYEAFMARRYLRGAQGTSGGRRFLRLITWISVVGIAVGVAALILALSIVRGFSLEIDKKLTGFAAHVQVQSIKDEPLDEAQDTERLLRAQPFVKEVDAVLQEFILVRKTSRDIEGVAMWGTTRLPAFIQSSLIDGVGLEVNRSGRDGLVIGASLARLLGVETGDLVTVFSVQGQGSPGSRSPSLKQLEVTGIYESSLADFDDLYVFAELEVVRSLLGYGEDEVTRFDVRVADGVSFDDAADRLDQVLSFPAMARPVTDIYRSLYAWVALQESIIPLIISIIVFVAAVNIVATLLMIILEKRREMGILASMGATARSRRRIFVRLGLLIGGVGVMIGEVIALILSLVQSRFGIIPLPADAYYMSTAPIRLHALDFVAVAVVTLALCIASSWIPAKVAGRLNPIQAIRSR